MNANSIGAPLSATPANTTTENTNTGRADMAPSRRALLAGMVALPLAACPAPVPAAGVVPAGSDPVWSRLLATHHAAETRQKEAYRVYSAHEDAWSAGKADREPAPQRPETKPLDTSLPIRDALVASAGPEWEARWDAYEADRKAWEARSDTAHAALIGDAEANAEASDVVACDAFFAMRDYPVATLAALAEKTDAMLYRYGNELEAGDALALIADIRRLAGREA